MKGVILAAGKGTRMQPLTSGRPKPLIPVANKPVLEHIIAAFKKAGIKDLILVVSSGDKIKNHFGKGKKFGVNLSYVVQKERLGTAHAISKVKKHIKKDFIVAPGDDLIDSESIKRLKKEHSGDITFCLSKRSKEELKHLGVVKVKGKKVQGITEKPENPAGKYASTATFAFSPEIFKAIDEIKKSKRGEYELPDAINVLLKKGKAGWVEANLWQRLSYPWDILKANEILLKELSEKREGIIEDNVTLKGKVSVGKGTRIKSGAYIEGPAMIGKNCTIGPNCFIRNHVTLGNGVRVG
ncbi:MAG: sugar phosphate nucleotidyltransferase, partial [Candidatus Undinarchaeales archaeon]